MSAEAGFHSIAFVGVPLDALRSGFRGRREWPWRGGGVRPAAGRSDRVRKSRLRITAVDRPVSERDGDVGSGLSGRATPTTARTRRGPSARGLKAIATIGASIGAHIPSTARAIALRRATGNASVVGGGWRSLQRWTRQGRFRAYHPGLIGWCRRVPQSLQRWTRGSLK